MEKEKDYIRDIAEIRSMMERSSKFLSLSGWAGIMAGIYALAGAYIAHEFLEFRPDEVSYGSSGASPASLPQVVLLAGIILILALGTAVFLSQKKASTNGEKLWNPTAKRLLMNMAVPLIAGGLLILIMIEQGLIGLLAPLTLIFYGLAIYNASKFSYEELKVLGLVEIVLGLMSCYFVGCGLLFWALGFGAVHIVYGIYMNYKFER